MKQPPATTTLLFLFLLMPVPSHACSAASCLDRGFEMRSDFVVTITEDGKPLAGVTVEVTAERSKRFSGMTIADGTVHVLSLPPGDYWLSAELLGISAAYHCFHVADQPSRRAKRKLAYEWGDFAPATRRIAGKLIDSKPGKGGTPLWNLVHRTDMPIRGATLKLQNPITGAVYNTDSDSDGAFAFEAVPGGKYVLHLAGGRTDDRDYDGADLLVEFDPGASHNMLLLTRMDAGGGSCGGTSLDLQNVN